MTAGTRLGMTELSSKAAPDRVDKLPLVGVAMKIKHIDPEKFPLLDKRCLKSKALLIVVRDNLTHDFRMQERRTRTRVPLARKPAAAEVTSRPVRILAEHALSHELTELHRPAVTTLLGEYAHIWRRWWRWRRRRHVLIALTQARRVRTRDVSVRRNTENELPWWNARRGPRVYRGGGICRRLRGIFAGVVKGGVWSRIGRG